MGEAKQISQGTACAYSDQTRVNPAFKCPPCSGEPTHIAGKKLLCEAHAGWYRKASPFGETPRRLAE